MNGHDLKDLVTGEVEEALHDAAERVACELGSRLYGSEMPNLYFDHVYETAYQALYDGVCSGTVLTLSEYGEDRDLEQRVERDVGF